jgi:uncharacterized membrane protein YhhN
LTKDRVFSVFYLSILGVHILSGEVEFTGVAMVSKPLLIISLLGYFFSQITGAKWGSFEMMIFLALLFSLAGDILLMFQDFGDYFVYGLGSFLLAHIFYIIAFTKTYLENHEIKLLQRYGWVMLLVVAYSWFFFNAIKDFLGDMMGPVLIYTMVISLMLLIALNRFRKVSGKSFLLIAFGAILFVASDSLIAWNKFVRELDYSHTLIMATYGLAQLGITMGAISQVRDISSKSMSLQR